MMVASLKKLKGTLQALDAKRQICFMCGKQIKEDEMIAIMDLPNDPNRAGVVHLDHPGVVEALKKVHCEIMIGSKLIKAAEEFNKMHKEK